MDQPLFCREPCRAFFSLLFDWDVYFSWDRLVKKGWNKALMFYSADHCVGCLGWFMAILLLALAKSCMINCFDGFLVYLPMMVPKKLVHSRLLPFLYADYLGITLTYAGPKPENWSDKLKKQNYNDCLWARVSKELTAAQRSHGWTSKEPRSPVATEQFNEGRRQRVFWR